MGYEVQIRHVEPSIIASVRRSVAWDEIGQVILPMFDEVYAFLKANGIGGRGQNIALYHGASAAGAELEAGVQVAETFEPGANVARSETPGGLAAHTVHFGEYHLLGAAHEALIQWLEGQGKKIGLGWEVYGDWSDDPAKRRTDVYRLVEACVD
jgi:effector-binding domain-containing protein